MNEKSSPLTTPASEEANCPSCGRFVGPHDRCPYCGTGMEKRLSLRVFKIAALFIAIVGLACLHLMALHRDIPVKNIEEITPQMSFGFFTVKGEATMPLRYYENNGRVNGCSLTIDDGTGEIRIRGYQHIASALKENDVVIRSGDNVEASGTVQVRDKDNISILLQAPEHLVKTDAVEAPMVAVKDLENYVDGDSIRMHATIDRIEEPFSDRAPYSIYLKDGTGNARLVLWQSQFEDLNTRFQLASGALVDVRGIISEYRGRPQIKLETPEDLTILASASATDAVPAPSTASSTQSALPARTITQLSFADVGKPVMIEARVREFRPPPTDSKAPYILTVTDGSRSMPIVFWNATHTHITDKNVLKPGAKIKAKVTPNEYRGNLQLKLQMGTDITYLGMAEETTQGTALSGVRTPVASVKATPVSPAAAIQYPDGQRVTVTGIVSQLRAPRSGSRAPYRIMLKAAPNDIDIICWSSTFSKIPLESRPRSGLSITAVVTVNSYRDTKQLKLENPTDISITSSAKPSPAPVDAPDAKPATPATLTPDEAATQPVGKNVIVKGKVVRVYNPTGSSRAPHTFTFLSSAGKEIDMICWPSTYNSVTPDKKISQGDTVTVRVKVDQYKSQPQLKILSANDIREVTSASVGETKPEGTPQKAIQKAAITPEEAMVKPDGTVMTVKGTVSHVGMASPNSRAPHRIYLKAAPQDALIVCWNDVMSAIPSDKKPALGAVVQMKVTANTYKGTKQLKLSSASDYTLIAPPPVTAPAPVQ